MLNMSEITSLLAKGMHSNLVGIIKSNLQYAFTGNTDQFMYPVQAYLNACPVAKQQYYESAVNVLNNAKATSGWKVTDNDIDHFDKMFLSLFGLVCQTTVVGVDMSKETYTSALYTRDIKTLIALSKAGCISSTVDIEKVIEKLVSSNVYKNLCDNKVVMVRLDVESYDSKRVVFKPVMPRPVIDVTAEDFVMIPLGAYKIFEAMVGYLGKQPIEFVKGSAHGQKRHIIGITPDVVKKAYEECDADLVKSKLRNVKVGFDIGKLRFIGCDLESSVKSIGVATFKPEMLDKIGNVDYAKIDKTQHNIDYNMLRGIFRTRVNQAKSSTLEGFKLFSLEGYATVKDKVDALINFEENSPDRTVYNIMMANPLVFGDINKGLATREKTAPKFLKGFEEVKLPNDAEAKEKYLKNLMESGIVKLVLMKKDGSVCERYVSDNTKVVERMLGKDWKFKYGSPKVKLYAIKEMVAKNSKLTGKELQSLIVKADLMSYINPDALKSKSKFIEGCQEAIDTLEAKPSKIKEGYVLYKNVYANDSTHLYGNVHVSRILSAEFREVK